MTVAPEVLYSLGAFALISGRICGGVQWHHWNREQRRRDREARQTASSQEAAA